MLNNFCLFMLLVVFSGSALAEFYVVYPPPPCRNCSQINQPIRHHKHAIKSSVRSKPFMSRHALHTQTNACGECETCSYGAKYDASMSQPIYHDEYCTTYEDVIQGNQNNPSY